MQIMDDIQIGATISNAMEKNNPFDRLLLSMVHTGEESGMLPETLGKMAELYEDQVSESIKLINSLLEPIMTVIIAVIVGVVIISMVLPMFGIYRLL
jgi:type IV pilus assembly protein PilC